MFWLIYCAFFVLMLFSIFRMLLQRGTWAWILFLGLIASAGAYVGLFVLPLASSASMGQHRGWLAFTLIGGTVIYLAGLYYVVRKVAPKLSK
jgi:hypothetical protein